MVPRARRPGATSSACWCCAHPTRLPLLLPGAPTAPAAPRCLPDPVPSPASSLLLLLSPPLPHTSCMRPSPPCIGGALLPAPCRASPCPQHPNSQPVGTPAARQRQVGVFGNGGVLLHPAPLGDEPLRGCRVEVSLRGSPRAAGGGLCPPGPPQLGHCAHGAPSPAVPAGAACMEPFNKPHASPPPPALPPPVPGRCRGLCWGWAPPGRTGSTEQAVGAAPQGGRAWGNTKGSDGAAQPQQDTSPQERGCSGGSRHSLHRTMPREAGGAEAG